MLCLANTVSVNFRRPGALTSGLALFCVLQTWEAQQSVNVGRRQKPSILAAGRKHGAKCIELVYSRPLASDKRSQFTGNKKVVIETFYPFFYNLNYNLKNTCIFNILNPCYYFNLYSVQCDEICYCLHICPFCLPW